MAGIDFDASEYKAVSNFEPLPPGEYPAIITDSVSKITKAGTGEYIELTIQIIDGVYSGRRVWDRLNIHNPNDKAQEIARGQLNALKQACGVALLKDSEQLHNIPFTILLAIDGKDPTRNSIKGYKVAGAAKPPITGLNNNGETVAAKLPWQR
tara:strand:+ start:4443 stop:4901 length:459 start_codon:yes stop_codon:yes gene_type:complete